MKCTDGMQLQELLSQLLAVCKGMEEIALTNTHSIVFQLVQITACLHKYHASTWQQKLFS